jgi:acylphosphatase
MGQASCRARVFFSGTVQGVGFRYTAQAVAGRFAVTGWVRNRSDGRVEALIEGSKREVESFIEALEDEMRGYVSGKILTWEASSGEFIRFAIAPSQ